MRATIHQPDLLPWPGLFAKIAKVDTWVVLDHVENNPRDAAFWGRRVGILVNGASHWLSVPLERPKERGRVGIPILDMRINMTDRGVFTKALRTVEMAYRRAPHFDAVYPLVRDHLASPEPSLMTRNMAFMAAVMTELGIKTRVVYSSDLACNRKATALLVEILRKIGADTYVCGGGSSGYQHDQLFEESGITLEYNQFVQPEYRQLRTNAFVRGLSIVDCLMNIGFAGARELLHLGTCPGLAGRRDS